MNDPELDDSFRVLVGRFVVLLLILGLLMAVSRWVL